jgi:8-oxoguanine deaminase
VVAFRIDGLQHAGAWGDPVAALVTCSPVQAWLSVINGKVVVEHGALCHVELDALIHAHRAAAQQMLSRAGFRR